MRNHCLLPALLAGFSGVVCAAASAPASITEASMAGSMFQVFMALMLVLALIVAAAWLMRRFSLSPTAAGGLLRVVSGVMVGQRERVVIVEVGEQWLVLGVTAQSVNLLSSMSKPEEVDPPPSARVPPFAEWLGRALQKRTTDSTGEISGKP